ncbi:MAG: hypothetical protein IJG62_06530 [Synergistaceae bacterium]|nr:hypothetical protein [Synergistaceae bacterium]
MKRELDYIYIDNCIGCNQDWLPEFDMNRGGCAAVTACDLCMYLSKLDNFENLYKFKDLTRENFIKFASIMKPYLTPRYHGIDYLEIYLCGLGDYWRSVNYNIRRLEGLAGSASFNFALEAVKSQIDLNLPIPYLMLNHADNKFEDFEWHWFMLAGYDELDDNILVKAVTYGEVTWLDFKALWNTGCERRGGLIKVLNNF